MRTAVLALLLLLSVPQIAFGEASVSCGKQEAESKSADKKFSSASARLEKAQAAFKKAEGKEFGEFVKAYLTIDSGVTSTVKAIESCNLEVEPDIEIPSLDISDELVYVVVNQKYVQVPFKCTLPFPFGDSTGCPEGPYLEAPTYWHYTIDGLKAIDATRCSAVLAQDVTKGKKLISTGESKIAKIIRRQDKGSDPVSKASKKVGKAQDLLTGATAVATSARCRLDECLKGTDEKVATVLCRPTDPEDNFPF